MVMDGYSQTPKEERIKVLQSVMPEIFDEGKIDWEKLRAVLGEEVNIADERYRLNWAGKSDAFRVMQEPSSATLIPCREESVDFDNTQNIFIEGENMEVLKVLQKSYFGRVKMIYIDPPYNTGSDSFIYPDRFSETREEYMRRVGDKDDEGYMLRDGMFRKNSKENGQYHSNWLNMMMPRLYLAKSLLREDGVIFVSIDDNEVHNLRLLMNEIFGEDNFIVNICHKARASVSNDKIISENHNHILLYAKSYDAIFSKRELFGLKPNLKGFDKEDNNGKYKLVPVDGPGGALKGNPYYEFKGVTGYWRFSKERMTQMYEDGLIVVTNDNLQQKYYLEDAIKSRRTDTSWWDDKLYTSTATRKLKNLLSGNYFTNPKPIELITRMLELSARDQDDIILDFFAGSGTTAHAVMLQNREDGGSRKYICVQLPELCDENSEAGKVGYKTIADIAKERIRRAGANIRAEIETEQKKQSEQLPFGDTQQKKMPDLGFKVFKLADSNFKQWRKIRGSEVGTWQQQVMEFIDPVAENATVGNMVYELLLKSGKGLNSTIEHKDGYYAVNGRELILMLEVATQETVDAVLAIQPDKVIALDRLFEGNDQLKTNAVLQMKDAGITFITI